MAEGKCATTFPSPAVLAATFNRSLWKAKGQVQSDELRAYYNLGGVRGSHSNTKGTQIGLNGWGPNINVVRDPRYGRNSELPSEDPTLNGEYAVQVVRGMQEGTDPAWPVTIPPSTSDLLRRGHWWGAPTFYQSAHPTSVLSSRQRCHFMLTCDISKPTNNDAGR